MVLLSLLVFDVTRRMELHQAALAGLLLIPAFFYPANYYYHYVFLLPLLGGVARATGPPSGRGGLPRRLLGWVSLVLLAMCVVQYFTLEGWSDVVYTHQSYIILAGFGAILIACSRPEVFFKPSDSLDSTDPAEQDDEDEGGDDEDEDEDDYDEDQDEYDEDEDGYDEDEQDAHDEDEGRYDEDEEGYDETEDEDGYDEDEGGYDEDEDGPDGAEAEAGDEADRDDRKGETE
jgi:hypothetical protein